MQILNRLLEHRIFPKQIDGIRIYFQDAAVTGIIARNQIIEMATASLSNLTKERRAEGKGGSTAFERAEDKGTGSRD